MQDELLDIVNDRDDVIGTIYRSEYDRLIYEKLGYIRAAELFIVNSEGRVWVPVRTADKRIAPNGYDYSAGGHVESGEDYTETIIRETREETNIVLDPAKLEFVTNIRSEDIRYFRNIYIYRSDETPDYNPKDFTSAEWLTPEELVRNIEAGHPAKSNLRDTVLLVREHFAAKSPDV